MDKSKTWLEIKMDKFKDDPEYLTEYISTLVDEIAFYKERFNARFAEGFRKGQESVNPTESPPPTPKAPD